MASDGNADHSRWFATRRAITILLEITLTKLTTTNRDAPRAVRLHDRHGNVSGNPPSHRIDDKATMKVVSDEKVVRHKHELSLVPDIPGHGGTAVVLPTTADSSEEKHNTHEMNIT
ncbi:hypothetical protein Sjap_002517 [Stephania japonica]|uniref:Uncharacterized protein n=1 Tax=Stephania japonica TaxID=461633 RepID=A0AAP0KM08_9MAGN